MFVSVIVVLSQVEETVHVGVKSNWGTSDADKKEDFFVVPLTKIPKRSQGSIEAIFQYALMRVGHHKMDAIPNVGGRDGGYVFNAHVIWDDGAEAISKDTIARLITASGYNIDARFHQPKTVSDAVRNKLCGVKQEP